MTERDGRVTTCFNSFRRQPWTSVSNGTADSWLSWEVSLRLGRAGWDAEDAPYAHYIILKTKVIGIKKYSWLQLIFTSAVWQWIIIWPNSTQQLGLVTLNHPTHNHATVKHSDISSRDTSITEPWPVVHCASIVCYTLATVAVFPEFIDFLFLIA